MKYGVPKNFHELVAADPLFAAEGMDLDNATASLDALESALTDLEPEYAGASFARKLFFIRYPLAQYAVPSSFLRAIISSERARRVYIAYPTLESARALLHAWTHAQHCLSNDLGRYRTLHEILIRIESDAEKFVMQDMFGYLTSYRFVMQTLDVFKRNADALRSEIAQRRELLEGDVSVANASRRPERKIPVLQKGEISPWHRQLHEAEIACGVSPYRYADILESYGPYRIELANFDEKPRERTFMVYIMQEKKTPRKCMWVSFVDKFHFIDLWNFVPQADSVTRGKYASAIGLHKDEIPFWYEGMALLYNTRDLRYWMDIATAIDAIRRPQLDRDLIASQRSSLFDLMLAECARDMRSMIAHLRRRARSGTSERYSLVYDLLTRTYPSAYYMPFNRSVWRLNEEPPLIGDGFQVPNNDRFLSDERMQKELTPDMIAKVMGVAKLREERGQAAGWLPMYGE